MAHNSTLGGQDIPQDVHDIRGTDVHGADGSKLGEVSDVIVDHDTMAVMYLVVDSQGWLEAETFLLPADRIFADETDENRLVADVGRGQIKNAPEYDNQAQRPTDNWKKYEREFKSYWEEEPVMHMKGSDRIIVPIEAHAPGSTGASDQGGELADSDINAANLFPERMTPVFSDTKPGSSNVTLRPKRVARVEEAASGVNLLKPRWWESFENYLRLNKDEIQAKCSECSSKAA